MNPKEHIEAISKDYAANARIQGALIGAMQHVKRSFSRRGHLLMEFLQNAEDCDATKMYVRLDQSELVVCNNGTPFERPNVDSICSIGRSSKTAAKYIGYLGVGFKSAFLLADRVVVNSGKYQFAFDSSMWPINTPWQIMPVWVDEPCEDYHNWPTVFMLRHLNSQSLEALRSSLSSFQPRTLLWLNHLTDLVVIDGQTTTHYEKNPVAANIWRIKVTRNGGVPTDETWLIIYDDCPVPDVVREDQTTRDWDREEVEARRVAAAFRLNEQEELVPELQGSVYVTIYSYTPLKDEPVPISFLLQGDFITAPNRESIHREAEWNKWLARQLFTLLRDKCIPRFLAEKRWNGRFQSILKTTDDGNHPIWDDLIRRPLAQHLATAQLFPAADGPPVALNKTVRVPENMKGLISQAEIDILDPGRKILADHVDFQVLAAPADSLNLILHSNASDLLESKAVLHDIDWFIKLYQGVKRYLPLTRYRKNQFRDAVPFLLTDNFGLSAMDPDSTFTNPNTIPIPAAVAKNFNVLHPALFTGSTSKDMEDVIVGLGVRALSEDVIRKAVVRNQLPKVGAKWVLLDDSERMYWIKFFMEYAIDSRDLGFVTLPTKSKVWEVPSRIIFSTEYNPVPDIGKLAEMDLLDPLDVTEPYLDPVLLDGSQDPGAVSVWATFLKSLGVGTPLSTNRLAQLAQRAATRATIQYEKARGNEAIELPETDSHLKGYDVISKSKSDIRLIEAKGRTGNEEITITHNQWNALLHHDDYYVYVVTEALTPDPLLYPIKGANLKNTEFSLRIQPATWKSASAPPTRYSSFH